MGFEFECITYSLMFVSTILITIIARNYSCTFNVERRVRWKASRSGLSIVPVSKWNWFEFSGDFQYLMR